MTPDDEKLKNLVDGEPELQRVEKHVMIMRKRSYLYDRIVRLGLLVRRVKKEAVPDKEDKAIKPNVSLSQYLKEEPAVLDDMAKQLGEYIKELESSLF